MPGADAVNEVDASATARCRRRRRRRGREEIGPSFKAGSVKEQN